MSELVQAGNTHLCDIYCGGDFVDSPYLGHSFIVKLIDILRGFRHTLYLTLGNHDILGRNLDTYKYTTVGILEKAKVLKIFNKDEIRTAGNYQLRSNPYNETDSVESYQFSTPTILISHNMLIPFTAPYTHIHTDSILPFMNNLIVLCGHYHPPFSISNTANNVHILNPGSTGRVSRGDGQNRIPQYFLCEVDGMSFKHTAINYASAKPWSEVFIEADETNSGILDIKTGIEELMIDGLSMTDVIKKYGQSIGATPVIVDECVRRVNLVEQGINSQKLKYGQ